MKRILVSSIMLLAVGTSQAVYKAGDVRFSPRLLNYQGYLTDTLGNPITSSSISMTFAIFDAASAGNQKWTETQPSVGVDKGIFHVLLGSVTPIPDSVFLNSTNRWLELTVAGQTLAPRTQIVSSSYSYTSIYSDTAVYARNSAPDNDWNFLVSDGADTTLQTGSLWGIARAGNVLWGNADSTHVNLGVASRTGLEGFSSKYCTVSGGYINWAAMDGATVGGGYNNAAAEQYTTVCGGFNNVADLTCATVGGGNSNSAIGMLSTVCGGQGNVTNEGSNASTIGGGADNRTYDDCVAIGGGFGNIASGNYATIGGGYGNYTFPTDTGTRVCYNTIGGGCFNYNAGGYSVIAGGYSDTITATGDYSYLFGINSDLTQDSTFMVDIPHIRFGKETGGYEFPITDGSNGQVLMTDGTGQVSWGSAGGGSNQWTYRITDGADTTLQIGGRWGLARAGNVLWGNADSTHVNWGVACTTGYNSGNEKYCTVAGGLFNSAGTGCASVGGGNKNSAFGGYSTVAGGYSNSADELYATVAGGDSNIASGWCATIGGGKANFASVNYATVAGGENNTARQYRASICGGGQNDANGVYATVAGGYADTAFMDYTTVGGGFSNLADHSFATVGGGENNTASEYRATVGGGQNNTASGVWSTIAGGRNNIAGGSGCYMTVSGGLGNIANAQAATVAGGDSNIAGWYGTVSGGMKNEANGSGTTIGGGWYNTASGSEAVVAGGQQNTASGGHATVGGGSFNYNTGDYSVVVGGFADTISMTGDYSYLFGINSNLTQDSTFMVDMPHIRFGKETGGYEFPVSDGINGQVMVTNGSGQMGWGSAPSAVNHWYLRITDGADTTLETIGRWGLSRRGSVSLGNSDSTHVNFGVACTTGNQKYATIGGGYANTAMGLGSALCGGWQNHSTGDASFIGGGSNNSATSSGAVVAGGQNNTANYYGAMVGGGWSNQAGGDGAAVCGGAVDSAKGYYSCIGGGAYNKALGSSSAVSGGWLNTANETYGFVGGGYANSAYSYACGVLSGYGNNAGNDLSDSFAVISGGYGNRAIAKHSFVGGGYADTASGSYTVVTGGWSNIADDYCSTVGGGENNFASGNGSVVSGGGYNLAGGSYSAVGGGVYDTSTAAYSFTAGYRSVVPSGFNNSAAFNGLAATAAGQTRVGILAKNSGTFTIDHPLDPENKILNHYFVESPEMVLIYRGSAVIGEDGRTVVHLPDYFDALNEAPMIQLTGIKSNDVWVEEKVNGNQFAIGGKPGIEVYWTVTGARKDPSAEITKILMPVEQTKEGGLAGRSLDDAFLAVTKGQLERMGKADGFKFRHALEQNRYEDMKRMIKENK